MKKNYQSILVFVILLSLFIFYFFHTAFMMQCFLDYSSLFLTKVVPVSFPMLMLSSLLISYGMMEQIPFHGNSIMIFILSFISGFPSGAKYIRDLWIEKRITIEEGNQMLLFSHFPNPLFVLGTISMTLNDAVLSKKILASLILSNFILFLFCKKERKTSVSKDVSSQNFTKALKSSIDSSLKTIRLIYGTSLFFYFLSLMITKTFSLESKLYVLLCGLFDLTMGVMASTILSDSYWQAFFLLFFISFGSIAIHMQVKSILSDTSLSYTYYFLGRWIGTILSFVILYILLNVDLLLS